MAFANYTELQAEIRSFLWDRTDVVSKIPTFITLAEAEMKRLLRTQQVVQTQPYTVSSGIASIPCNGRQILAIKLTHPDSVGTFDLDYETPEQASQRNYFAPARPRFYTIEGGLVRLFPTPDRDYEGTIVYRSVFCALSGSNRSNWVLEMHPDIYLAGALKWAKAWLIDSDQDWSGPFYGAIDAANKDQPMRQMNSRLRNDDITIMSGRGGFYSIYTDSYGRAN
jgi:hypothetical protein